MSNKVLLGEVFTDKALVEEILDLIPREKYDDPRLRWLDPACGSGIFMHVLAKRLFCSLEPVIPHPAKRWRHIRENMLFMVEINDKFIPSLRTLFPGATILSQDFLSYTSTQSFDIIIGNPPFNSGGVKRFPQIPTRIKRRMALPSGLNLCNMLSLC